MAREWQYEKTMKPESVKQMKRFTDARDLLYSAHDQYKTTLGAIKGALDYAERAMGDCCDEEALRQIVSMRKLVADLPRAAMDTLDVIAETMSALAVEVSVDEEHVAAGVS